MVYLLVEDQRFLFHLEDPFDSANHQNIFLKICAFIQLALLIRKKKKFLFGAPPAFSNPIFHVTISASLVYYSMNHLNLLLSI